MRVVSVLPSATEIVFALGHGAELVGRSAECDFPSTVKQLPVVMRARTLDSDRPSVEIDARVRRARSRNESLYQLDIGLLKLLRPDLLLTQDLCGVCSVTEAEVAEACGRAGVTPRVVSLAPRTLVEVWASFTTVALALNDPDAGAELRSAVEHRARPSTPANARPAVAVVEWVDPPILAGLWVAEIVRAAGGTSVGPVPGTPGERTSWEEIRHRNPDLLIISPCSFAVPRTLKELSSPTVRRAVSRVAPGLGTFVADEAYFSRPGPRLADGVELIRGLLAGRVLRPPMPVESWGGPATPRAVA